MKLVVDTNVLISGTLWNGPSADLLTSVLAGRAKLFLSLGMLLELREVLERPQFAQRLQAAGHSAETICNRLRSAAHEAIPGPILPPPELRDRDDFAVLASAVAVEADLIVSGDKDLLTLGSFQGIPIVNPTEALKILSGLS